MHSGTEPVGRHHTDLIGSHDRGEIINVSLSLYIYGPGAPTIASVSEARWRAWVMQAFPAKAS